MTHFTLSAVGLTCAVFAFSCSDGAPAGPPASAPYATSPSTESGAPSPAAAGGMESASSDAATTLDAGGSTATADAAAAIDADDEADAAGDSTTVIESRRRIAWDTAGATLTGTGCMAGDATAKLVPAPHGVRIDLPELKIDLKSGAPLAERKACSIRIPVEVPAGYYVSKVDHELAYSVRRSAGTSATAAITVALFGTPSSPLTVRHSEGRAESRRSASAHRSDTYASSSPEAQAMCGARPTAGLLAVNLAITAQRNSGDRVSLAIKPMSIREGVEIELSPCP